MIAMTTDGGLTWTARVSGVAERLHGVHFTSADSGFVGLAVSEKGVILFTQDGGAQWVPQVSGTDITLNAAEGLTRGGIYPPCRPVRRRRCRYASLHPAQVPAGPSAAETPASWCRSSAAA